MSIQPFVCVRSSVSSDPGLNSLPFHAHTLFFQILLNTDSHGRFSADLKEIRGKCLSQRSSIRLHTVAHWLEQLQHCGAIVPRTGPSGSRWIEIADHLRHARTGHRDPRYGVTPPDVQTELPLGPMALTKPKPMRLKAAPRLDEIRRDKTINRAVCGEHQLIASLAEILPPSEMMKNGGGWRTWIRECKRAVQYAIEDWKLRTPQQRREIKNRAAWLSDRYKRALVELEGSRKAQA